MQGVNVDTVQVVNGASEALLVLTWLAAEPGANVILPQPGFTTFSALPESLLLETGTLLNTENSQVVGVGWVDFPRKALTCRSMTIPRSRTVLWRGHEVVGRKRD